MSTIQKGGLTKKFNYYQNGERATTLVASETFGENNLAADKLTYIYDKKGNISEIRENGELVARYEYDSLNRLVREDNRPLNKSYFMSYDTAGNIVEKKESAFTLGLADTVEKITTGSYVYGGSECKKTIGTDEISLRDKLLSFNDQNFEYDVLGNPTIYRNKNLSWSHINRLAGVGDNIGYKYNYAGIRLFKTIGDKTTKYYCDGAKVIAQDDGTDMLYFYYGTEGVTAFKRISKDGTKVYHYKKDMLSNILGIYDANGQLLVKYSYDAWGNHKTFVLENNLWVDISARTAYTESDSTATKVAILNPFRYRSYYYDIETGLYYLQSRYYDPETGRFISPDNISYLDPEIIGGLNLYSYCLNNPVIYIDPTGHLPFFILTALIGAVIGVGITAAVDYFDDGAVFNGSVHWGWYLGATLLGAAIGAGIGMGISYYATNTLTASFTDIRFGFALKAAQNGNYDKLARFATHNNRSKTVGLGKYIENSPNSYEVLSKKYGYTYYELKPKYWKKMVEVLKDNALNVNTTFLDQQLALNKTFVKLSSDYSGSYLMELAYLGLL